MIKPLKAFFIVCLTAVFLMGTTSTAFAQDRGEEAFIWSIIGISFLGPISTVTTAVGAPLTTAGVVLTIVLRQEDSAQTAHLERYMRDNAIALQHDLHIGGGETTADLAALFKIPEQHEAEFAEILYDYRHTLAPLAEPGHIDRASAREFGATIANGLLESDTMVTVIFDDAG